VKLIAVRRFAFLAAIATGCGGQGETPVGPVGGSGGSGATVTFALSGGAGTDVGKLPAPAGDASLESVTFWIGKLSLGGDRSGDGEGGTLQGQSLDLTGGPVSFDLPNAAPALYSRVRVDFGSGSDDEHDSSQNMTSTFRVTGKTADGAAFVLSSQMDLRLDLRVLDGVELGAHTRLACAIRLDVRGWFAGVSLADAAQGSDARDQALQKLQDNLVRSASLTVSAVPQE
jgi:hypothetical protein